MIDTAIFEAERSDFKNCDIPSFVAVIFLQNKPIPTKSEELRNRDILSLSSYKLLAVFTAP
jgi:hypothetical protein